MVKVADYVISHLADRGVRHVFVVTGGAAMHLNDALAREPRILAICNHHEQACTMAAEGCARVNGGLGVASVTAGPGAINSLNGVFGAWTDSIPMLVISGQAKRETCMASYDIPGLRQLGDQEVDIISMVKGITKYAVSVHDPDSTPYHLDRAIHLAVSGRAGPCWLDFPIDVQASMIEPSGLPSYSSQEDAPRHEPAVLRAQGAEILRRIREAKRPVILAGSGVRAAKAEEAFEAVIRQLGIPVATAWTAIDLLDSQDPLYCGRPGTVGDRAGNFAVQNADVLLVLACRLAIRQSSYNWQSFARHAFKIQVDVDPAELQKPTVRPDLPVTCDARVFLEEIGRQLHASGDSSGRHAEWLQWCKQRVVRYPVVLPKHRSSEGCTNPYHFSQVLFERLQADDVVACGDGAASVVPFQAAAIKKGQRVFTNSGSASMGYDLPAAIGAAVARAGKRVICLAGDGSIQMNIQELQTVAHHGWPIKIFVFNNNGYLSIRTTQQNFFGRLFGESAASGVSFPDMTRVAGAYGIDSLRIDGPDFSAAIDRVLNSPGPFLCEVMLDPSQIVEPRLASRQLSNGRMVSSPLEDMFPFLPREEFLENMLVPPAPEPE
jgi:acetolactate synthase-1/2/3 large subunit